jgi:hypothetical protein
MAFETDKEYPNRKDNRRVYKYNYAKSVDRTCRNHGGCNWCMGNRFYSTNKLLVKAKDMLEND